MATEPENLVIELLRTIRSDLVIVKDDMQDLKVRVTRVEEAMVGVHRRLDRLVSRVEPLLDALNSAVES
jgi:hypothetical protein